MLFFFLYSVLFYLLCIKLYVPFMLKNIGNVDNMLNKKKYLIIYFKNLKYRAIPIPNLSIWLYFYSKLQQK